uniref:uncharacterized protein n=1 Tax=Pristiophorus japonicus TaxID=55135 RepID=UPI00398F696B
MEPLKKKFKCRNFEKDWRLRAPTFDDTELPALLENITQRYSDLTKNGCGRPIPKVYNKIWDEIGEAVSSTSTMLRNGERCRKRWNDLVRVARKKKSAIAADQRHTGRGPPMQESLSDIEIRAVSLVGDTNCATTHIGADLPTTQDESEDSNHPSGQCTADQSIASTSVVTHQLCDLIPHRDDEDEEQHIFLQPVELEIDLVSEQDKPTATVGAETLSSTESVFLGFPNCSEDSAGTSHVHQQGTPSVTAPLSQRRRLLQRRSSSAARQESAYRDMVRLSQDSVDLGRELLTAMATIAANIVALNQRPSEDMSRLITVME